MKPAKPPRMSKVDVKMNEDVPAIFVNHVICVHQPDVFHLHCCEIIPPLEANIEELKGQCVAHLVLGAAFMETLVTVLQDSVSTKRKRRRG